MAGLLDNIDGDTILSGLLSAGAASGAKGPYLARVAAGLAQGERFKQARSQEEMQKEYRALQVKKLNMEMKQAEAAAAKQAKISQWTERLLGGDTSPGAFQTPVDGRGPVMPPSRSGIANASLDQVAGLHALGGPNLMDAYKFANTPQSFAAGSTMLNPITREQTVIPKLPDGMRISGNGMAEEIPGFGAANAGIKGAEAAAIEKAKAAGELVSVPQGDGSSVLVPKPQALNRLSGGGSGPNGSNGLDMSRVTPEQAAQLMALDPAAFSRGVARFEQSQSGPKLGVTQSPAEAAAAKSRAESAAAVDEAKRAKGQSFKDFRGQLELAKGLLKRDPTGSVIGAGVDKALGAFGGSTESSKLAQRLETTAAWMIQNIPKAPGAQSEAELKDYKTAAGLVGNRMAPVGDRLAAVDAVEELINKWEAGSQADGNKPATTRVPASAVNELKMRKGDPKAMQQFDEIFGEGAAMRALGGVNGR